MSTRRPERRASTSRDTGGLSTFVSGSSNQNLEPLPSLLSAPTSPLSSASWKAALARGGRREANPQQNLGYFLDLYLIIAHAEVLIA